MNKQDIFAGKFLIMVMSNGATNYCKVPIGDPKKLKYEFEYPFDMANLIARDAFENIHRTLFNIMNRFQMSV